MMREDAFSHKLICSYCGNGEQEVIDIPDGADSVEICSIARKLFDEGQYDGSRLVLNKLDKLAGNRPDVLLMKVLCGFKVMNTEELLNKVDANVFEVSKLAEDSDLNILANKLMFDHNLFVVHVLEYCLLGLRLSGEDMSVFYSRLHSDAVKKKPESVLARLDAEEAHNEERTRRLREADRPEPASIPGMVTKYMNTAPVSDRHDNAPCSTVADNLVENILMDVIDMLAYDRVYSFYNPEFMSRTRKYNVRMNEIKAREAESDNTPCDDISENMGLTDDEMRSRRVQLLRLIIEEEKEILLKRDG
jgi:hypothetical protein